MQVISSRTNDRVKNLLRLCNEPSVRRTSGECVAYGLKLADEAARLGAEIKELWLTESAAERCEIAYPDLANAACETVMMSESVAEKLSDQPSKQGALAVISIPNILGVDEITTSNRIIALCGVQDPANVGTAIRTASAFGWRVLLDAHCADPFSPKALRSSMGAVFSMPIARTPDMTDAIAQLLNANHEVLAATLRKSALTLGEFIVPQKLTIAIGSEGRGLPQAVEQACPAAISIPMTKNVESLNAAAAAAILMWELRS